MTSASTRSGDEDPAPLTVADAPASPGDLEDRWLDQMADTSAAHGSHHWRTAFYESFGLPLMWARRAWLFVSTTPGKMVTLTLILSVAIFAAGYSMAQSSDMRRHSLDVLVTTTEPMSYSAHNLYTSLSLADTVATTGFVQAGAETPETRSRYNAALEQAAVSLTRSAYGTSDASSRSMDLISSIHRDLLVYSGLVDTARVNNRLGNPVGAAYMAAASNLMRDDILPAANELFALSSSQVSESQKSLSRPQWVPLSGLVAALLFLLIAQWWLWRITRRRFNRGFLAATGLMLVALVWVGASNWATWQAGTRGFAQASMPWDSLTNSRIAAHQARTIETLALVRRQVLDSPDDQPGGPTGEHAGDTPPVDSPVGHPSGQSRSSVSPPAQRLDAAPVSFRDAWVAVDRALTDMEHAANRSPGTDVPAEVAQARAALQDWQHAHEDLVSALSRGDYQEAVKISTSTNVPLGGSGAQHPTAAQAYNRLDASLTRLIAEARTSMRSYIHDGLAATNLVSRAVMLLSVLAVVAVWAGIRPRLQEYL